MPSPDALTLTLNVYIVYHRIEMIVITRTKAG
jgi:hypothetical protein